MSFLLIRSSPWLHEQALRLPVVGQSIREWDEQRGVRRNIKRAAYVWVVIAAVVVVMVPGLGLPLKLSILALVLIGLEVIRRLPVLDQ